MTGQTKPSTKTKVYDQVNVAMDDAESHAETEDPTYTSQHDENPRGWIFISEGDEDASFVADFENAAADVLQNDADLSATFLHTQKPEESLVKKRVPIYKGRGKSSKGKGKVKGER